MKTPGLRQNHHEADKRRVTVATKRTIEDSVCATPKAIDYIRNLDINVWLWTMCYQYLNILSLHKIDIDIIFLIY